MNTKEIWLNREFTNYTAQELRKQIIELAATEPETPIIVYINSYGGTVDSLNMLIDTFKQIPNEVITVCAGTSMSAGAILLSCGKKRYITPNSRVMVHKIQSWSYGNIDDIKNETEETIRMNKKVMELLAKNCKKTVKQIENLLKEKRELYLSAEEALAFGIVDAIGFPYLEKKTTYEVKVK